MTSLSKLAQCGRVMDAYSTMVTGALRAPSRKSWAFISTLRPLEPVASRLAERLKNGDSPKTRTTSMARTPATNFLLAFRNPGRETDTAIASDSPKVVTGKHESRSVRVLFEGHRGLRRCRPYFLGKSEPRAILTDAIGVEVAVLPAMTCCSGIG
jgi:hypothetical protein